MFFIKRKMLSYCERATGATLMIQKMFQEHWKPLWQSFSLITLISTFKQAGRLNRTILYVSQIHWPVKMKKGAVGFVSENLLPPDIPSTWRAMEALYASGKARAIGVSNFSVKKLGDLLEVARVPPAVNQVECHPAWQQPKLRAFCQSKNVHLSGYSPLGSPGTTWIKGDVLNNPILTEVAEKLGKTRAQVALRWGLQMGHSVLPKSTNETRIKENIQVHGWSIPDDLFAKFSEIEQASLISFSFGVRLVSGTGFVHETYGAYRSIEELWDGEV
ncbi:unnamed protein product [Linum tenue]|uniref:NADP-dependent oxidoreductase domain-containing protein n=1 Tax=Linum tenue TaxID=586396 RepID=A0AAV0KYP1_9ROSI|nr:unnamed protein product [Linum tenue]